MASLNRVMLMGSLTRNPEGKQVGETSLCTFGMAINRKFTSQGQEKEEVCFVDCECWGKTADSCLQYLAVGRPVFVEGRLKFDQWEKDGQKRSKLTVTAERIQFLGAPQGHNEATGPQGNQPPVQQQAQTMQAPPPAAAPQQQVPQYPPPTQHEPF